MAVEGEGDGGLRELLVPARAEPPDAAGEDGTALLEEEVGLSVEAGNALAGSLDAGFLAALELELEARLVLARRLEG